MLQQSPLLYQPTIEEISKVAESAKRRHEDCASRIDKAAEILLNGAMQLDAVAWEKCQLARWRITSQSNNGTYVVTNTGCPCQDSRAPHVAGGRRCKHAIAVSLYLKVLANCLNTQIVRARTIDLGILPDATFHGYAKRLGVCRIRKIGPAYVFSDMASAVRFSIWLAAQQSVAVEWPVAVAEVAQP